MLSAFLSIIDRLIKLKEYRDQRVQKVFDKVLEPIFNDLLLVHRDYIQMFVKVQGLLPARNYAPQKFNSSLREAADYLRQRRIEFEPARVQLRAMIREIKGTSFGKRNVSFGAQADEFIDSVVLYFQGNKGVVFTPRTNDAPEVSVDAPEESDMYDVTPAYALLDEIDDFVYEPSVPLDKDLETFLPMDIIKIDEGKSAYVLFGNRPAVHEQVSAAMERRMAELRAKWIQVCESFAELKVFVMTRG